MSELLQNTILAGRYSIDYVIGAGGFGITYHAYHIDDHREVAIKEFFISGSCVRRSDNATVTFQNLSREKFEKFRSRFHQEAQFLQSMNNSHIVPIYDVFQENNTSYMVMEYIKGETLQKRIAIKGRMSYNDAVNCIAQLCEAVGYIHEHHILHRDIKPDNIMITPSNKIVLIDFGSARTFVHDSIEKHTAIVTHGYAPLEQYSSDTQKGNYTDLYAVGGVFYFLLTGSKPPAATQRAINDTLVPPIVLRQDISEAANRTILKALKMDHTTRYQSVKELMNDLIGGEIEIQGGGSRGRREVEIGFIMSFFPFLCIVGLIFSIRGYRRKEKTELAIASIVLSSFMIFISLVILCNI